MPIPKRELLRVLVEELVLRPEVLHKHASAHVWNVVMRTDDAATGRNDFRARLRVELADLANITIVADCHAHRCLYVEDEDVPDSIPSRYPSQRRFDR